MEVKGTSLLLIVYILELIPNISGKNTSISKTITWIKINGKTPLYISIV